MAIPIGRLSDVLGIMALNANDLFTSKSLFMLNNNCTIWRMKLIFDANGIDRQLSTRRDGTVPTYDQYCMNFANSKRYVLN